MSIPTVNGDIFHTRAQTVALAIDASGRLGTTPLYTALHDRYPVFVSEYHKRGRANLLVPGSMWIWREGTPWIVGLVVRETPQGATRLRYVESAMLNLLKNWQYEGITSLALMRLGDDQEWPHARQIVESYLAKMGLPATIYEAFKAGIRAEEAPPPE